MENMDRWPPLWFQAAAWGFVAFTLGAVVLGQVSGQAPFGLFESVLGGSGMAGLFFIGLLFALRAWMGVEVSGEGNRRPIGVASRSLALFVAVVFFTVCVGTVLFIAGLIE